MVRITYGILGYVLLVCSLGLAQSPLPTQMVSYAEPPIAEPGEINPAPPETTVVPGQPGELSPLVVEPAGPEQKFDPRVYVPDPATGIQPAQFVTPVPASGPTPVSPNAIIYPEPPSPTVKISVKGMDTAPTGQELTYRLTVANISEARAHNVIARCPVPRGTKLVKSLPEAKGDGKDLEWHLETLEAGASRQIEVVFKPNADAAEITVVGKVQFEHGRVIRTKMANPTIDMKKVGPAQAILHDPMTYKIVISNPGQVPVTDIQIVDTLPEGLEYVQETSNGAMPVSKVGPAPNQRTWTLAIMRPAETRTIEYRVMPRKIGDWTSDAVLTATNVHNKAGCNTAVHEARITLQVNGPANDKGAVNQATPYMIFLHNTGTAPLNNVRISCAFPTEMRLAKASNGGHLFKDAVQWVVPKLGPNETKEVSLSLIAPSSGLRDLLVSARADRGLEQRKKVQTSFEGIPALNWQTEGTAVASQGQEIVYTITISNPGSAPAKNVKVIADIPEQVEFRQAQPAFQRGQGAVFFNALEIPAKQTITLKLFTMAKKTGEARFHFEMKAEGMSSGPLKNTKATTISPSGEPKAVDPTRIGNVPQDEKRPEPKILVPVKQEEPIEPLVAPEKNLSPTEPLLLPVP